MIDINELNKDHYAFQSSYDMVDLYKQQKNINEITLFFSENRPELTKSEVLAMWLGVNAMYSVTTIDKAIK